LLKGVLDRYKVKRIYVPTEVDGSNGWVEKLIAHGFNYHEPTAWILEGFLFYLSPQTSNAVVEKLSYLSSPGSYIVLTNINKVSKISSIYICICIHILPHL
jgi:O-methyltransferase involved in polyketide biosynthesis